MIQHGSIPATPRSPGRGPLPPPLPGPSAAATGPGDAAHPTVSGPIPSRAARPLQLPPACPGVPAGGSDAGGSPEPPARVRSPDGSPPRPHPVDRRERAVGRGGHAVPGAPASAPPPGVPPRSPPRACPAAPAVGCERTWCAASFGPSSTARDAACIAPSISPRCSSRLLSSWCTMAMSGNASIASRRTASASAGWPIRCSSRTTRTRGFAHFGFNSAARRAASRLPRACPGSPASWPVADGCRHPAERFRSTGGSPHRRPPAHPSEQARCRDRPGSPVSAGPASCPFRHPSVHHPWRDRKRLLRVQVGTCVHAAMTRRRSHLATLCLRQTPRLLAPQRSDRIGCLLEPTAGATQDKPQSRSNPCCRQPCRPSGRAPNGPPPIRTP